MVDEPFDGLARLASSELAERHDGVAGDILVAQQLEQDRYAVVGRLAPPIVQPEKSAGQ